MYVHYYMNNLQHHFHRSDIRMYVYTLKYIFSCFAILQFLGYFQAYMYLENVSQDVL